MTVSGRHKRERRKLLWVEGLPGAPRQQAAHLSSELNVGQLQIKELGRGEVLGKIDGVAVRLLPRSGERARLGRGGRPLQLVHGENVKGAADILLMERGGQGCVMGRLGGGGKEKAATAQWGAEALTRCSSSHSR